MNADADATPGDNATNETSSNISSMLTEEEKKADDPSVDELTQIQLDKDPTAAASPPTAKTTPPSDQSPLGPIEDPPSAEDTSSILSRTLLLYLTPLLKLGATKILEPSDVGPPSLTDRAAHCHVSVQSRWNEELQRVKLKNDKKRARWEAKVQKMDDKKRQGQVFVPVTPNLARVLWYAFGYWRVWVAVFFYVLSALLQFVPVLILNDLVRYFETPADQAQNYKALLFHPWGDVVGLFIFPVLVSVLQTRSQVILNHCAIFIRTAVSTLLFEKALTISASGRALTSTGQVVNMMSNDTSQLQRFLQFFGTTLVAPVQIVLALALIYRQVGNATWVGVGFMLFLVPINGLVFSSVSKMRRRVMKYSDARVKMINEILAGIRIIKFYSWEVPFGQEVNRIRNEELKALTILAYTTALGFSLIMLSAPIINPILVFAAYIRMSVESLDAATAFTTIALFNIMRFPFAFLPMGFLQFIQSRIALRRLSRYLELSELSMYVVPESPAPAVDDADVLTIEDDCSSDPAIIIKDGTFSWLDPNATPPPPEKKRMSRKERRASAKAAKLKRVSESSKEKDSNGSRTSNLQAHPSNASLNRAESLASLGVSLNTAGSEEDSAESRIALKNITCTIERGSLVAIIGSVGSGKSSLLSAILGEMEALDGSQVFMPPKNGDEDVSREHLISYCSQSPWVVNDTLKGNILFGRPYDEARYNEIVKACALADDLAILPAGDMTEIGERGINLSGGQKARVSLARALYSRETQIVLLDDPLSAVDAHVGEHLFKMAITGAVSKGTTRVLVTHHVHFLPRCDKVIILDKGTIIHSGTYAELVARGVDFAGAIEVEKKEKEGDGAAQGEEQKDGNAPDKPPTVSDDKEPEEKAQLKKAGEKLISDEEKEEGSVQGSNYSHYAKAGGVIAFVSIFVIQAVGRASELMANFWLSFWASASAQAEISGDPLSVQETTWYLGIYAAFGIGGVICLTFRAVIMAVHRLRASRKLHTELIASILRAPVSFFDVTPIGRVLNRFAADMDKIDLELTNSLGQAVSTIFSFLGAVGAIIAATKGTLLVAFIPIGYANYVIQKWFRKSFTELQRASSVANSPIFTDFSQMLSGTSTIRAFGFWLGLRLDVLGGSVGFIIGAVALSTKDANFIPAGWLGLALSYSIEVTTYLKHGVRMIATVEADMNSVERVLFYTNNVQPEAALVTEADPKTEEWPSKGEIEIRHASMRYRDGPLVLRDLCLSIKGGEKIGVVGRTGSGKSSLMAALFRITELERDGGKILIDGVDISNVGLSLLRLSLSIIPQDPVMFSNTVRYNLDPFGERSEYELWEALKKVQLAEAIAVLPGGLDEQVAEGGENFSQGQRQLLCIARSLLRKPKILVMDEATASIDNATDAHIQEMIRENFASATILTIAHRLNTIMDSDRVLVLDDGRVVEFDSPSALLAKREGVFKAMVDKSKKAHSA
ncbi:hypothetical protein HJC23_002415 [Cyclotella cryptica]|uniref:ATP-dependent transporter ycf16 n=1 Tax=Cyclotella cryptica TaxID=29204 RepID=A0ABD3QLR3_9STRA